MGAGLASEMSPKLLDLFCGAGGLTLGAHLAGFMTAAAIDYDQDLTSSFETNFPSAPLHHIDLSVVDAKAVAALAGRDVDGVIGGPPCQGFSEMGRRRIDDPRNELVCAFMRIVGAVRPKFFLMENVPGLGQERYGDTLARALEELPGRYTVLEPMELNAMDYGAATSRPRLVVVGYDPNRMACINARSFLEAATGAPTSVRDAIADLPEPEQSSDAGVGAYVAHKGISEYADIMRLPPPGNLGSDYARQLQAAGLVSGLAGTQHSHEVRERFARLRPGERDRVSRYPKLDWDRVSPVLRAGTGRDRGSYQAARPVHPSSPRVITVREAARLQGFPDWFQFSQARWHSHRMIGNSVSPIFAQALLAVVLAAVTDRRRNLCSSAAGRIVGTEGAA